MNKKGISPLIATVLLVAMVAVLSVLVITFYKELVGEQTDEIGDDVSLSNYCLQGVDLSFEDICANVSNSLLDMKIKNLGSGEVETFVFQVMESSNSYVSQVNASLGEFSSKRYSFNFSGVSGDVDKISVIPLVVIDGLPGECPVKELEITSLSDCS
jgi:flagellin-like protein